MGFVGLAQRGGGIWILITMFDQMNEDVQFASILQQLEALYLHAIIYEFCFTVKMRNLKHLEINYLSLDKHESLQWLTDLPKRGLCRERELARTKIKRSYRQLQEVEFVGFLGAPSDLEFVWHFVDNAVGLKRVVIDPREVTYNGRMSWKNRYSKKEIIALDRAEKQLALQVPSNIKLVFLHPPNFSVRCRALGL
ncbi:hypothetical protein OROGR_029261 [Orobanche gracilis]